MLILNNYSLVVNKKQSKPHTLFHYLTLHFKYDGYWMFFYLPPR